MEKQRYSKNGLIALCSFVYFTSYFARKNFAAVTIGMLQANVLEKSVAGLIGTAMFVMYGVGQLISGYLGDRIRPKTLILIGLGTTALCNLTMPFITREYLMIPIWALNGLAQAMLWPPIVHILSEYLPHETYVKANLLVTSAAHVATVILYLYVPVCLNYLNWQAVFISAATLTAITFAIFIIGLSICLPGNIEKNQTIAPAIHENNQSTTLNSSGGFIKLLLGAGLLPVFGAIISMGFLRDGIESWLPTLYAEAFNRTASESTLISVALPIFSIISVTLITLLHKKIFQNEVLGAASMFIFAILLGIPLILLINTYSSIGRVVCLILAALICGVMHSCNFLLISCLPGRFARFGRAAGASGICNACTYVGAAISTYGIALISEKLGWCATIVSWIIVAAFGMIFCLAAVKRYTSFYKSEH